jgi:hypothetical protein
MAAHSSAVPDHVPFRTLPRSGTALIVSAVLVLLGLAALLLFRDNPGDPGRVWRAVQFNWLFWASLAQGMVMFAVALHLTNARWAWSVRRFALAGVAFLPVAWLLLGVVFLGHEAYFGEWLHSHGDHVIEAKRAWLSLPGMIARDYVGITILFGLSIRFAYLALRPDVYGAGRDDAERARYARLTGGWRGVEEEAHRSVGQMNVTGVVTALVFSLVWGMIGIDLAMSMMPHWYSTMFPVAFFIAAFHAGIAATTIAVVLLRPRLRLEEFITTSQFHDLGKLVFAFAVFWMYLNWSQYVVIWYGILPHEQVWFARRFDAPFTGFAKAVPMLIFVIPFLGLLSRPPKKVPAILAVFCGVILVGNWLERFMITTPSVYEGGTLPFGLLEIGVGLGFLGLFIFCYTWFMRSFPALPSPAFLNAHGAATIEIPVGDTAAAR